ncbi:MAG: pilus assembly protein [Rhodobacteraceae bacterium]|jgi:Flp pilus assembly pilin Flp|nr:pilus assembly protein [Paracoccaceae bacterium]
MKLLHLLRGFGKSEDGAVTVDWVVLTAAIVLLGLVVVLTVRPGISASAGNINTQVTSAAAGNFAP